MTAPMHSDNTNDMQTEGCVVSVIMPAYNCGAFIKQAADSVLAQTFKDIELIVIDDCSSDNTQEIMKQYLENPKVKYYRNETNLGVCVSRNKAINMAKGRYIAFLDADDWWQEDKLKRQLEVMDREKCAICCSGRRLWTHEGTDTRKIIHVPEKISYRQLLVTNNIGCSTVLIPADIMREFPMEHDEVNEDYLTWLRILKKYGYAYGIDEPFLNTRLSQNGKSRNKFKSIKMNYGVYRYAGYGCIMAAVRTVINMIGGIMRYIR